MPSIEQVFKAYYASMTDAELMTVAYNRNSFILAAQKAIAEELRRRNLTLPADSAVEATQPRSLLTKLRHLFRQKKSG